MKSGKLTPGHPWSGYRLFLWQPLTPDTLRSPLTHPSLHALLPPVGFCHHQPQSVCSAQTPHSSVSFPTFPPHCLACFSKSAGTTRKGISLSAYRKLSPWTDSFNPEKSLRGRGGGAPVRNPRGLAPGAEALTHPACCWGHTCLVRVHRAQSYRIPHSNPSAWPYRNVLCLGEAN